MIFRYIATNHRRSDVEITIQQATFERLQRYAKPFVDTPDTVIIRALDALDQTVMKHVPNGQFVEAEQLLDPLALPDLTHTKMLDAANDGKPIAKPKWNLLRDEMLLRAMRRVDSFESLQRLFQVDADLVEGRKKMRDTIICRISMSRFKVSMQTGLARQS